MIGVPMEVFIKRLFYVAYKASVVLGAGFIRAINDATEDEVWKNVTTNGDYAMNFNKPNDLNADYVFGKMMKLGVKFTEKEFEITRGDNPRYDYQSWVLIYPTVDKLIEATANTFPNVVVVPK